ncbi:hypothetical protein IIA15_03420 [candidate division TA06 bacterium]|nr:hypothetical protein [candidate division TA06 bacterium]
MFDLSRSRDRNFLGTIILTLGLLFLLNNLGILNISLGTIWLPLLLIVIGLWQIFSKGRPAFGPSILVGIGLLWLLQNFGWLEWRMIWPLLLILVGIWILFKKTIPNPFRGTTSSTDEINLFTLFGGSEIRVDSQNFQGGNAMSTFGGIEIDLRDAQLAEGEILLNVSALFGGVEIRVPEDWSVVIRGTPILGGIEDARKRRSSVSSDAASTLIIRAFAMFGGVEVRS